MRYAPGAVGKSAVLDTDLHAELRDHPVIRQARARFGATFTTETQDLIQRYTYLFGVWEPHLTQWLERRLKPGDAFVDVGANIGYYSLLASHLVGESGKVVSIEASPRFHSVLVDEARGQQLHQPARRQRRDLRSGRGADLHPRELAQHGREQHRPVRRRSGVHLRGTSPALHDVLSAEEIAKARVIKTDVEGAEGAAVRGLEPVLDELCPDVELAIEVTSQRMAELGQSADELLEAFTKRGFNVYRLANDYAAGSYHSSTP
ncbi:FkbM family methyltransferase [Streptomyces sp. CA-132043]|uniref:FkbM family methyltransferase n=1 Tax=Streptomyces sp. CA-132043 TaxID=3240048 RepID=UPI003D91FDDF